MRPKVTLSIFVAITDVRFMMNTISHLIKACNYPFFEKIIAIDTAHLSGYKPNLPGVGTLEELRMNCNKLLKQGIIDKVIDIDYGKKEKIYKKHFGKNFRHTHNYKGYPIFGSAFCIDEAKGDYVLHFDSDMLLYQDKCCSWIEEGIKILEENKDILGIRPHAGPIKKGKKGFEKNDFFGSRCYLIKKERFEKILPLPQITKIRKRKFLDKCPMFIKNILYNNLKIEQLDSWEQMVSLGMNKNKMHFAHLNSNKAWTLHPCYHGPEFIKKLPKIIKKIEKGNFPEEQEGIYDLRLEHW